MSEERSPVPQDDPQPASQFAEAVAKILEANGLGDRFSMMPTMVTECAKDAGENRLLLAEVGTRRFFVTLSPAMKGRLVGEDNIEDDAVRQHFEVNIIGGTLKK
ncbi:MAG: hypothetical protein U0Y68_24190 [Blastocatellia bacterium]